ncbi:MAG: acetate kinase [Candidatus Omnitrophica bacterium]|nr:acetate kinase [Candidatus Omnitrophota bacterium]
MNILTFNCGSSSIKYQLFRRETGEALVKGIAEKIGTSESYLNHEKQGKKHRQDVALPDYYSAIEMIVRLLTDPQWGAVRDKTEIAAIGHRVVHGGEEFTVSVLIDAHVLQRIQYYAKLAPLHNPPAYNGIKAARKLFPGVPQVAVFDTAFHQGMPEEAFLYGLPYDLYRKYCIRRYGFHGTSHRYVAEAAAKALKKPLRSLKLITCHLGNGCSISAVKHGRSVDTSMGFTPLEGLMMGTRSGDVDPALISYLMEREKRSVQEVMEVLNRKSGLFGVSGISNDMRDLLARAEKGHKRARLAIDMFIYRVKKYIGAYLAVLNGVDAVVLTAGIGENTPLIKSRLQQELSNVLGKRVKILTLHTDEERLIAEDTYAVIKARR